MGSVKGRIQEDGSEEGNWLEEGCLAGSHCHALRAVLIQCLQRPGTARAGTEKIMVSVPWSTEFGRMERLMKSSHTYTKQCCQTTAMTKEFELELVGSLGHLQARATNPRGWG